MTKLKNPNHPKEGDILIVEPIKREKDIKAIKAMLSTSPRDLALFVIGINTNLRASDLVRLKVSKVQSIQPDERKMVREQKTRKIKRFKFNKACVDVIQNLLASKPFSPDDFLFQSQRPHVDKKTGEEVNHITPIYLNNLVKKWTAAINLKGNYGAHTLRKTWGYHQRVTFNVDIPTLMVCFNHSTQRQTLDYLCIDDDEVSSVYDNIL